MQAVGAMAEARVPDPVLVRTKLHPPALRPGHVPRPALVEEMQRGSGGRVTLVRAPAGGGKTTLLSEWLASGPPLAVGWVSLDRDDDDPVRFWTYVLEALRLAGAPVPADLARDLRAPGTRASDVVLPRIVNLLASGSRRIALVLDDLHEVSSPEIHGDLRFLIERMPHGAHICLAARSEPPEALGLARLRARGEVADIHASDLRFDDDEAASLLRSALGRELKPDVVGRLRERTEGWAAGLYLAALSLRSRRSAPLATDEIAGDDRHLADYLTTEILEGLDSDVRWFLLRTSVLRRMCGGLCDEVAGRTGSAKMLEAIERSNLLIVPLDNRRTWFRYHHLFRDLLHRELEREAGASELRSLHRRASAWWESHGEASEAIHHALEAQEPERLSLLVGTHWHSYLERGQLATVHGWLEALSPSVVQSRSDLLLARAWVEINSGRPEAALCAAEAAETAPPVPASSGLSSVEEGAPMVRGVVGYMAGDLATAADAARRALEVARPKSPWIAIAYATLGTSSLWKPAAAGEADAALAEAVRLGATGENMIAVLHAHAAQGLLRLEAGERSAAAHALERALEVADREGLVEYSWASLASTLEGRLLEDRGDLDRAAQSYSRASALALRGRVAPDRLYALIRLARVRATVGDRDGGREALREARRVLSGCPDVGGLVHALRAAEQGTALGPIGGSATLSEREIAVLRMLASSLTQAELAAALYVSRNTIKTHVRVIYRKLAAGSREEALARGRELGLL